MNNSVIDQTDLIANAYCTERFQKLSQQWQQALSEHLQKCLSGEGAVLNWAEPADSVAAAERLLHRDKAEPHGREFSDLLKVMLSSGQNLHHPGYIGHQVPASVPIAGLFDSVGSITNQPMAIYEMGPWATAVEHSLVRALCRKIGWAADESTGVLTHGGSLANLTALLTARNIVFPNSWEDGVPDNAVLIAHADAHYCVSRSAGILGLGSRRIVKAQLDSFRRMDPERLEQTIRQCIDSGQRIMAVVACACATPIGAFDPISQIADICERYNIWLHVDAAHGGSVLMSRTHRKLLDGIERADSVVWDAHKMMFVPALCAAVLFRQREHRFKTFEQDAPYLFDRANPGMAEYDNGVRTVECTKRSLGFGLWGLWAMYGEQLFEQLVDRTFSRCRHLFNCISRADDFVAMHQPDCNIMVFRHLPASVVSADRETQNEFQRQLRARLVRSGDFYIVQTTIDGEVCLRACVMNPMTTEEHIESLLLQIRNIGAELLASTGDHP